MKAPKQIDAKQKKIIWSIAKKELQIDKETLYASIAETFGAERMSALTYNQAELLIKELRRKSLNLSGDRLTEAQYKGILRRYKNFGWTTKGLRQFLKNETGIEELAWLTVEQARMAITGMEKIKKWRERNPGKEPIDGIQ